jgi:hypothetical protein
LPKVLSDHGLDYFFYSNEGMEPRHIHVRKGSPRMPEASGKWWLEPIVQEFAEGFTAAELRRIRAFILANQEQLIHAWNQHFPAPPAPRR